MTPATELERLSAVALSMCATPEPPEGLPEVEETYIGRIQRGNEGIPCERGEANPDGADTLPIYPKPSDLEIER